MIKVGIIGATGYTGIELLRLLKFHPQVEVTCITSTSQQGEEISRVHPQFQRIYHLKLEELNLDRMAQEVDIIFCALPHGLALETIPQLLERGKKVIDLSADFRLKDPQAYAEWYNYRHPRQDLLEKSVYGLPEIKREEIKEANLVANPGCYPTSIILALKPLLETNLIDPGSIIVDSKSGVSGAGRGAKLPFHFTECTENFKAYRVANHQHTPEIEQELGNIIQNKVTITFTPHLVPMIRGILSTIYARVKEGVGLEEVKEAFLTTYGEELFIRLKEEPHLPETKFVYGTNFCDLGFTLDERTGRVVVISAIDNLVKGAAGQAIQNMNLLQGWSEETGLVQPVVYP
ncbi:MAG: N-acetyl-gamma-glutamyl-phosphate reductase [Candidatus Syntrophonatronum acetioxidans]|uniref:N-acetyl-gamma-glutamyl-phosphate reductase n=1 Tax=Candidatus Syntrophonatronum acetioxidans TaxID=1795816 RepID=A0A424YHM2_9FIRM|nr:MAG: N-acetyl-gamma-glutamyl-phosphate reductase [Candidatus Syntrophonatronum acetioxidans]